VAATRGTLLEHALAARPAQSGLDRSVRLQTAGIPDGSSPWTAPIRGRPIGRFDQLSFASGRLVHPVYYAGDAQAPTLLLLPEIAGFAPGLQMFAERLIDARFRVFVPWLFGPLGTRAPRRNGIRLCISREFAYLRAGVSSPITTWLRALSAHISKYSGRAPIGVIGMCLTGAFAIPLVIDPQVAAVRCRPDRMCPHAKIARLQREFPLGLEIREYAEAGERNCLGERPHATFTREYRLAQNASADHYSRRAFTDLVAFFDTCAQRRGRERHTVRAYIYCGGGPG
jgi:hypothetical protein